MVELDQFKYTLSAYEKPLQEVRDSLNLDAKIRRIDELDKTMEEPSFWEDAELSTRLVKEAKNLKDTVAEFKKIQNQYEELELMLEMGYEENDPAIIPEIQKMMDEFTKEFEALRLRTLLTGEYDSNNAIMRLNAGAGGTESCDWCSMLYRMYCRWAESKGYSVEVLDYLDGEEAGIKWVTMQINGENVFGYLKSERGVHRLVRISPFNSNGKRQTSFVSCDVMPDIEEDLDVDINEEDLRIDTYRSSMGSVHNYFPHVRFGDHSIRVLDGEGNVLERRHFFGTKLTADAKAAKIFEELKAKYGDSIKDIEYGKLQDLSEDVFEFPMRTADMEKVLQEALSSTGIDGDIKKKLLRAMEQQVSDLFKARGFGQHMLRRDNIAGYEMEDIGKVLFTYCSGQYGWLTKMDAAMKFGEALSKVDAKKKPRLYAWAKNYVMDMLRNADRLDALVDTAKNLMFLNFLGGNFKTAAVNLTQNLITGYPRLGVELGFKHAATSFIRDAGKALCHQLSDGKAKSITPEEKAFLQDFYDRGITRDNFMREMMGDLTGGRMSYAWRQFSRIMAWPMSAAERFNRTSLALAAYRAEWIEYKRRIDGILAASPEPKEEEYDAE